MVTSSSITSRQRPKDFFATTLRSLFGGERAGRPEPEEGAQTAETGADAPRHLQPDAAPKA